MQNCFFFVLGIMGNAKNSPLTHEVECNETGNFFSGYRPPTSAVTTVMMSGHQTCVRLSVNFSVARILFLAAVLNLCFSRSDSFPVMSCVKDTMSIERSSKTRGKRRFSSDIWCLFSEQKKKRNIC